MFKVKFKNPEFTQNRFAIPPLDLHWRNPTGQAGEACNLIKSAHDRLGYACEAYFGLLTLMDSSNKESEQNRKTLAFGLICLLEKPSSWDYGATGLPKSRW